MRPVSPALLTAIVFSFAACLALNHGTNSRAQAQRRANFHRAYDDATLSALRDYFQTFSEP